jgi:hypothetical protein
VASNATLMQVRVGSTDAYNNARPSRTAAKSALSFLDASGEASLKVALENTPGVGAVTVTGGRSCE